MQSVTSLKRVSAVVAQRMAYREMKTSIYVTATVLFYAIIVALAMTFKDISSIFDFVSAYAISSIAFFIPSLFYKKALSKFKLANPEDPEVKKRMLIANVFIGLGALNAVLGISSAIITITGVGE